MSVYSAFGKDLVTESINVVNYPHHEIHAGNAFEATDYDGDVDIAGPKYWSIVTPNTTKWAHFTFFLFAEAGGTVEFFETPTTPSGGSALTAYNRNRNSATTSGLTIRYNRSVVADGTRIGLGRTGTSGNPAKATGGSVETRGEIILKQNTEYIIKYTTDADNNKVWLVLDWYEHTNVE